MAEKTHCDRCDDVIGWGNENLPVPTTRVPVEFMRDKGHGQRLTADLRVSVTFDSRDECGDKCNVTLCGPCQEDALDEAARLRLQARALRHKLIAEQAAEATHAAV